MNCSKKWFLVSVIFIIVIIFNIPTASASNSNEIIQWGTPNLSIEAAPAVPFNLNFTSNVFIEKLEVRVSENISPLLVSLDPFLEKIEPNTSTDIRVAMFIPPEAKEGWNNGTLTLVSEGMELSNPIELNIFVPTIYKEEIPGENGVKFVKIATPSHSQFSEDTVNVSHYLVFPNGTSFFLQAFYDLFVEQKQLNSQEISEIPEDYSPPHRQIKEGISSEDVRCKNSLELILKYDGSPACVKPESIPKLIERGWAKNE